MLNQIERIEVLWNEDKTEFDVDFYFLGSDDPFVAEEFKKGSDTRNAMETIINMIATMP